jgi:hypothetical protein
VVDDCQRANELVDHGVEHPLSTILMICEPLVPAIVRQEKPEL